MKRLLIVVPLLIAACSPANRNCLLGYAAAGAAAAEVVLVVGAVTSDCNADCEQRKIALGESVSQAAHHHVRQRNDIITYGSGAAVLLGGLAGFGVGELMCDDDDGR